MDDAPSKKKRTLIKIQAFLKYKLHIPFHKEEVYNNARKTTTEMAKTYTTYLFHPRMNLLTRNKLMNMPAKLY
ncbi:hypothetical protein C4D60_Mb04t30550 [Musa balbisiana]|uniref:Uncharacterized protein n=1 Tax=Musa balbisiana TaxID=52838 RepID=A0A4S8KFS8_MUSBA|nr:hypothetical protein C4D60_Mb04t30550 [Musa balbisiana]